MTISRRNLLAAAAAGLACPALLRAQGKAAMRLRCRFADQDFTYRLLDNPTVRDLVSLLPLDLTIEDFSTNEKLAHLPRRLDEGGLADFTNEAPGDLCYFRGWGNLAFFHGPYRYRGDLIRLGHIEGGVAPLLVRGEHPLRVEPLA
ncbi:cyclophilin-like fold protein [Paracoccus versutus]|uniref:Cyclophilin-like domain-containing protein n=1 Tax=Paracoccus versutus TaxID=34007 RepID=A0A3D9Y068_PARVE|nr:cyclophilin-like fold protein [Paracoccus versutus]REF72599.1 hypothetical protein BDD41_1083 [Paracoccus versutus]